MPQVSPGGGIRVWSRDRLNLFHFGLHGSAVNLKVVARILNDNGAIDHLPLEAVSDPMDGTTHTDDLGALEDGWLQGLVVYSVDTGLERGQLFVDCGIQTLGKLGISQARGYAYDGAPVTFGQREDPGPGSGHGWVRHITTANPAALSDLGVLLTVPSNAFVRMLAVKAKLTTSADAANRRPGMEYTDGATMFARSEGNFNHTATVALTYVWGRGVGFAYAAIPPAYAILPLPSDMFLPEGYVAQVVTTNLDTVAAGDDWDAAEVAYEQWAVL